MAHTKGITSILAILFLASPGLTDQHNVQSTYSNNPCGAEFTREYPEVSKPFRNKAYETQLKKTRFHLKMALDDFNNINKTEIGPLYTRMHDTKPCMDHNLPHGQYFEYIRLNRVHKNMTSENMAHYILPKLLRKLTVYGKAFDKLSEITEPKDTEVVMGERRQILNKLKAKLRSLCCEIETSINMTSTNITKEVDPAFAKVGNDWHPRPSMKALLRTDMNTFTAYKNFLEEALQIQIHYFHSSEDRKKPESKRHHYKRLTGKVSSRKKYSGKFKSSLERTSD